MHDREPIVIHTTLCPPSFSTDSPKESSSESSSVEKPSGRHAKRVRTRKSFAERLLRDTAVACALLLTVMALKNADFPWARAITATIDEVLTMDIQLDESLGRLTFVQNLMPESVLAFLNWSDARRTNAPTEGTLTHEYRASQPWLEYVTRDQQAVYCLWDGEISAHRTAPDGTQMLLIAHDGGAQSVYAYLSDVRVAIGESVRKGDVLGVTGVGEGARLYYEYRVDGQPQDPTQAGIGDKH